MSDVAALAASLDELSRLLTEHFAHEEHAKGFCGLVGARSPQLREELSRMIEEHQELLGAVKQLVDRAKAAGGATDLVARSGELAARLLEHESREVAMARSLV